MKCFLFDSTRYFCFVLSFFRVMDLIITSTPVWWTGKTGSVCTECVREEQCGRCFATQLVETELSILHQDLIECV